MRILPPGFFGFDDVRTGDVIETEAARISADLIDSFAALSGDHFEIHMSQSSALAHGFPDRVAHGLLVLSIIDGLKNTASAQFKAIASLGWSWSFCAPVLAGDTVGARITILDKRETKKRDRGILTLGFKVTNQRGELVQDGQNKLMVYR